MKILIVFREFLDQEVLFRVPNRVNKELLIRVARGMWAIGDDISDKDYNIN